MDAAGIAVQLVRLKFVEPVDHCFLCIEDGENTYVIDALRHAHRPGHTGKVAVRQQVKSRFRFACTVVYRRGQPGRHGGGCELPFANSTRGKTVDPRTARRTANDKVVEVVQSWIAYFAHPAIEIALSKPRIGYRFVEVVHQELFVDDGQIFELDRGEIPLFYTGGGVEIPIKAGLLPGMAEQSKKRIALPA